MEVSRQEVCDLATRILGPGKLRMLGEGEFYWIADNGVQTHLGWNLRVALQKLQSMTGGPAPLPQTSS
jgi:hypothetical protein